MTLFQLFAGAFLVVGIGFVLYILIANPTDRDD